MKKNNKIVKFSLLMSIILNGFTLATSPKNPEINPFSFRSTSEVFIPPNIFHILSCNAGIFKNKNVLIQDEKVKLGTNPASELCEYLEEKFTRGNFLLWDYSANGNGYEINIVELKSDTKISLQEYTLLGDGKDLGTVNDLFELNDNIKKINNGEVSIRAIDVESGKILVKLDFKKSSFDGLKRIKELYQSIGMEELYRPVVKGWKFPVEMRFAQIESKHNVSIKVYETDEILDEANNLNPRTLMKALKKIAKEKKSKKVTIMRVYDTDAFRKLRYDQIREETKNVTLEICFGVSTS